MTKTCNKCANFRKPNYCELVEEPVDGYHWCDDFAPLPELYYNIGGIETIDFIKSKLSPEEYEGFLKGNVLKYLSRAGHKDDKKEDYRKAKEYMGWLCDSID